VLSVTPAAGDRHAANFTTFGEGSGRWPNEKLLALVRWMAAEVAPWSRYRELTGRKYELLERTADYELWVIYWPVAVGLSLHDHGGSAGAFQVVDGVLEETSTSLRGRRLRRRLIGAGRGKAFGPEYVHSIVNPETAPATSVHAYSPALSSMTFYSRSPSGLVVSRVVTEWEGGPPD
jgi:Cysteine dioxygenase type I